MKILYFLPLLATLFSGITFAASFVLNGTPVNSKIIEKSVECGEFKVILRSEGFPFKYEGKIPIKFRIKGFYGPDNIVNKEAMLLPSKVAIPSPNSIKELQSLYPENRTYLPTSAVCKGNVLIISYWSGGSCSGCEIAVKFEMSNGIPTNPMRVGYSEAKALK